MEVFRITHKKWSNTLTASGFPARWNSEGIHIIYTAGSRALACLENIVHRGSPELSMPFVTMVIAIPDHLLISELSLKDLPAGWSRNGEPGYRKCRKSGDDWIIRNESAVLKVPSAIIQKDSNYLLNPGHADFQKVRIIAVEPFVFDERLIR